MIVVSDTTPLRYPAVLGQLPLLPSLFSRVWIPRSVLTECGHQRAPLPLRQFAEAPPEWLSVEDDGVIDHELLAELDPGEAAALALAQRLGAKVVLIDEREARRMALARGFTVAGTLTVLAAAGRRGWVDYPAIVATLRLETNFRMTDALIAAAWEAALRQEF